MQRRFLCWAAAALALAGCGTAGFPELEAPGYLRSGSPHAVATDLFTKAISLAPDRVGPLELAGTAYLKWGYDAEADKLLGRILEIAPDDGYNLADTAAAYIEARREDRGLDFWAQAKKVGGAKARTWLPVACAWARVGNVARAEEFAAKLMALPGGWGLTEARRHRDLGFAWLDAGQKARADAALEKALALGPENGLQMIEIGAALLVAGDRDRGEALLKKGYTLEKEANAIQANREVAAAYITVGALAVAEPFAKTAISLDPAEDDTYLVLGAAFLKAGKAAEGEDMLGRALRAAPGDWELMARVGAQWLSLEPAAGRKSMRAAPAGALPAAGPAPAPGPEGGEPTP